MSNLPLILASLAFWIWGLVSAYTWEAPGLQSNGQSLTRCQINDLWARGILAGNPKLSIDICVGRDDSCVSACELLCEAQGFLKGANCFNASVWGTVHILCDSKVKHRLLQSWPLMQAVQLDTCPTKGWELIYKVKRSAVRERHAIVQHSASF